MAKSTRMTEADTTMQIKLDILGMAITETDHLPAARDDRETTDGLLVMAVRWGGTADLAGVATGDIISEVDGRPTRTIRDLNDLLAAHAPQTPVRLLMRRVGMWRYLALPVDGRLPGTGSLRAAT